jgi:GTP-binding protein
MEPIEYLVVDVPDEYVGAVIEKLSERKGQMLNMNAGSNGFTRLEFNIPSRSLIGYRSQLLTDTRGNGIMNHVFHSYEPHKGDVEDRQTGSIVVFEDGESSAYGLYNTQDRGRLFIGAGVPVYEGMIVGESPKAEDLVCNVCKKKHLTNTRASGSDDALRLTPPVVFSLEQCLEFLKDDEYIEVTPESLRLRKAILKKELRLKAAARK